MAAGANDRTGTGTRGLFGRQIRIDLADGFPLLTTKKVFLERDHPRAPVFVRGDTNYKVPDRQRCQNLE